MSSTKFTPETRALLLEALRENPSIYSAAAKADVTYPTVMKWLQRGQQGDEGGYVAFLADVEEARSMMKDEIVQSLYEIACDRLHPQAVRAAKELLSSLYPREFSTVKHVVQHKVDAEPALDVSQLSDEELRSLTRLVKKVQDGNDIDPIGALPAPRSVIDVVNTKPSKDAN